jgi:DNA-binding CsgD family transcriptional regulator
MESTGTTATNSDANEFCIGRTVSKIRLRKIGATPAQTQGLATKKGVSASKSAAGFLLIDSLLHPVLFNAEAVQILGYPDNIENLTSSDLLLTEKIRSSLITRPSQSESVFVTEFRSGRRRYFCRTFLVDSHAKEPSQAYVAVLLERGPSGLVPLSQISQQFKLTQREREVLEYLLQGMSSKVIANRMNLSPSTVKAFVRLIMIKTGVSSRSAIVAKIMMIQRNVGA